MHPTLGVFKKAIDPTNPLNLNWTDALRSASSPQMVSYGFKSFKTIDFQSVNSSKNKIHLPFFYWQLKLHIITKYICYFSIGPWVLHLSLPLNYFANISASLKSKPMWCIAYIKSFNLFSSFTNKFSVFSSSVSFFFFFFW